MNNERSDFAVNETRSHSPAVQWEGETSRSDSVNFCEETSSPKHPTSEALNIIRTISAA